MDVQHAAMLLILLLAHTHTHKQVHKNTTAETRPASLSTAFCEDDWALQGSNNRIIYIECVPHTHTLAKVAIVPRRTDTHAQAKRRRQIGAAGH